MIQTQKLTTQQIGKLGELLVQYRLLSFGIESAHLTTDSGIDLIAYAPSCEPVTIQVKANLKPKPGGGKGKAALDWWVPENSPAKLFAFVDVSENRVWLFNRSQLEVSAQQLSNGRFHLYMYTDQTVKRRKNTGVALLNEFDEFILENCIDSLLQSNCIQQSAEAGHGLLNPEIIEEII
ncbi:MAG: hypothetical protein Q8L79_17460 [Methylobacter sp.]|uniref:hypothetical protein n=1 Tax=Methylobacter sp. TaxID=2051955 RepID=UPI002730035F|nr:hypothetical protein [Methylobacter sp.]MDP1666899.1 hypothetical protein [Methylobacter sp.]